MKHREMISVMLSLLSTEDDLELYENFRESSLDLIFFVRIPFDLSG